jgi:hypothetical protein
MDQVVVGRIDDPGAAQQLQFPGNQRISQLYAQLAAGRILRCFSRLDPSSKNRPSPGEQPGAVISFVKQDLPFGVQDY